MVLVIIAEYIHIIVYSSELTRQDELATWTSNTILWIVHQRHMQLLSEKCLDKWSIEKSLQVDKMARTNVKSFHFVVYKNYEA